MAASSPCSSSSDYESGIIESPSLPPHRLHHFTPIQEGNESEEDGSEHDRQSSTAPTPTPPTHFHQPTPLHPSSSSPTTTGSQNRPSSRKRRVVKETTTSISCNNCRPSSTREYNNKTTSLVVPVIEGSSSSSSNKTIPSPNVILKSILSTLAIRSPRRSSISESETTTTTTPSPGVKRREERWKIAAAELSQKLVQANRKRDEAVIEAGKLKQSVVELEKKLCRLEVYCRSLKSGIEGNRNNTTPLTTTTTTTTTVTNTGDNGVNNEENYDQIIENFLTSVAESRSTVRHLSRELTSQIRQTTGNIKHHTQISSLSSTTNLISSKNPRTTNLYLESLLHNTLYTDFESPTFTRHSTTRILNPIHFSSSSYTSYKSLRNLTWEEVLSKGTKHYSEDFSAYCDRKMSEIVNLLGWKNVAWPENLLQAFFSACKSVWLVHLLVNSVRSIGFGVFRVEKGCGFDEDYMEDLGKEKVVKSGLVPSFVKVMVAPGFYVGDHSVIKCKVICRYVTGRVSLDGVCEKRRDLNMNTQTTPP